jgi:hypothetical protein
VDRDGFVSIAWIGTVIDSYPSERRLRFARLRDSIRIQPPILLEADRPEVVQLAVSPDGPATVVYEKIPPTGKPRIYTYVAMDGRRFLGPYLQSPPYGTGTLSQRRCVLAEAGGKVHVVWTEKRLLKYVESWDYGRTFPRRDIIDPDPWNPPSMSDPMLALTPDGTRCIVDAAFYYSECGG